MLQVPGGNEPSQRLRCRAMSLDRANARPPRRLEPLAFTAVAGLALLFLFLIHPALQGFRFPVGPDGPVYTWLARLAGAAGFGDMPGGGPGVPGLTLTLGSMLRIEPLETVMLLGPVLATTIGLAAGALLEATLGENRLRTAAGVILTGTFSAYLAGGWLANLAMVAIFLVALAVLSGAATSPRAVVAGAALLFAAGLTHRVFVVIGAVIVLGAAIWQMVRGNRASRTSSGPRLALAAIAGPGAALLLGAWIAAGPPVPGDTSQDGFFRRVGLRTLLLDRYRERFLGDATRASVPILAGLGLSSPWTFGRAEPGQRGRFLREILTSWGVLTAAGILMLAATGWGPPYRLVQFAFFLPVAGAAGLAILARRSRGRAVLAAAGATLFAAFAMVGWFRQAPAFSPEELRAATIAGLATSELPEETPLVFIVDTNEAAAAYHVARASNVIRMGISAERITAVRLVVGQPRDVLAGHATRTGDDEHDRIAEVYLDEAKPFLGEAATLVIREFNESGFAQALGEVGSVEIADGVVAMSRGEELRLPPVGVGSATKGLELLELILLCVASLVALTLIGWGWSAWILSGVSGPRGMALAAPSVGVAVTVVGSVGGDSVGLLPGSGGSLALTGALAIAGYVINARRAR